MKARNLLPLVLLASALALRAEDKPAAASELGAQPAPAPAAAPAPNLTPAPLPAPAPASSSTKADPALDLIPAQPGQLAPAPTTPPSQATLGPEESMLSDHARPGDAQDRRRLKRSTAAPVGASKTEKVEQDLADLVRLRQAKTQALVSDPSFGTEFHAANERHTDLEKREALKKYYERLYTRIVKIDPTTSKLANERKTYTLHRLTQVRLTPTEALDEDQHVSTPFAGETFFSADF